MLREEQPKQTRRFRIQGEADEVICIMRNKKAESLNFTTIAGCKDMAVVDMDIPTLLYHMALLDIVKEQYKKVLNATIEANNIKHDVGL